MDKIQFLFNMGGKELLIGGNDFGIIAYSGLTASEYSIETGMLLNGRGERKKKKKILKRNITLEFEYKPRRNKAEMREFLIGFFSPDVLGTLTVERGNVRRRIHCEVEKFLTKEINVHSRIKCLAELVCINPFFENEYQEIPITTLIGGWKWKFTLPFKMRQYGPLKKTVTNAGHVETSVEIFFKGPAINPMIVNHRTGQYIRLSKELGQDDVLYINTEYDNKVVEIHSGDVIEDGWDYLDLSSEFWWLYPGENLIEYSGEGEDVKSKGVEIRYREQYLGI